MDTATFEAVLKCLVQACITGGEFIGIYAEILGQHPKFAIELLEEMQRSRSRGPISNGLPGANSGGTVYPFEHLKESRQKALHSRSDV
jgi:hypothetical protein